MRWALGARTTLKRVPLDVLTAFFDRRSGMTHLLAAPTPELLDALAAGPANEDALLARLGAADADADERAGLSAHLAALAAAGLVVRE